MTTKAEVAQGLQYWELIEGNTKVELEYEGEGYNGEYDPEDPDDEPLLRFAVYRRKNARAKWAYMDDSSYCTCLPATISDNEAQRALQIIMQEVSGKDSIKRICERLSWLGMEDLKS